MIEERGYADVEAKIPMNRKSIVRIYSMSKCVVAAAVLQLAEEGHLTLDDELSKHIPAFENPKVLAERSDGMPDFGRLVPSRRPITIRHLLTHTSGISCGLAPVLDGPRIRSARERAWANIYTPLVDRVDRNEFKCLADWVQELANVPLVSHPGQHYGYGYSYDVLGHLIELKSGKQLETYLRDHILGPLGMSDTGFSLTRASKARRLSVLYRYTKSLRWGGTGTNFRLVRVDPPQRGMKSRWLGRCCLPSAGGGLSSLEGGLLSTLDDYAKFLLAVIHGGQHPISGVRILSKASAGLMTTDLIDQLHSPGGRGPPSSARPYDSLGIGLSCIGEVQRRGAPKDQWFDGVEGVRQWGGAASCAFKYDPNHGRPILAMLVTQALPQDDGATITHFVHGIRQVMQADGDAA